MLQKRLRHSIFVVSLLSVGIAPTPIASGKPSLLNHRQAGVLADRIRADLDASEKATAHIPPGLRAQQIHLAHLGGSDYSIAWVTPAPLTGPHVRYRIKGKPDARVEATTVHRSEGRWSGHFHEARIEGLKPGLTVHYQLHDGSGSISTEITFRTEPDQDEFAVIAWGDLGVHKLSTASVWMARWEQPSLLLHTGDLSYANGRITVWDDWFRMIEPLASQVPYMTAPGNHEYEGRKGPAEYLARMALPGNERFFNTSWGSLDLLFLDTEESAGPGTPQGKLAAETLAAADIEPGRWKVVVLHRPPYSSSYHGSNEQVRAQLSPLLDRYDVDVVLAGHDHNYERIQPIWANRVLNEDVDWGGLGTVHLVTGTAGRPTYAGGRSTFTAEQASRVHYTRIHVTSDTLRFEAVGVPSGEIFDSFSLVRGGCIVEFAAGRERGNLPHVRDLRDSLLSTSDGGISLVERFYRHSPEMVTLASADSTAAATLSDLVRSVGVGVATLGERWALNPEDISKAQSAIGRFLPHASPELATELTRLDAILTNTTGPASIGMVLRQVAATEGPGAPKPTD